SQRACALVVCDGMSQSQHPDEASYLAVQAASAVLQASATDPSDTLADAVDRAVRDAHDAVCAMPYLPDNSLEPPATTIVLALVRDGAVTYGSVGDSRAYWVTEGAVRCLTHDDSWLELAVERDGIPYDVAIHDAKAHEVSACLGRNRDGSIPAYPASKTAGFAPEEAGLLLLCTDGLWNYLRDSDHLGELVRQARATVAEASDPDGAPPSEVERMCRALVRFALDQ